jgi:hypothetical protein
VTVNVEARPGWTQLREAADELHAAELLVGDPLATPTTAVPHLRAFWRAIAAAGRAAGIGKRDAEAPETWLDGEIVGLDAKARQTLVGHVRALAGEQVPNKRELRTHVAAARSLLARLEPEIGGTPLYRRKRQTLWAAVGSAIVLLPIALYFVLHVEVPGTGPWRAAYYADKALESRPVVVREDTIEHDWKDTAPHEKIAPDKFSIRWDTCLRVEQAGPVVFQVHANDGARVYVDGELLIDAWEKDPSTRRRGFGSGELELEPGIHHLRVEFFESLGDASIKLSASLDGNLPAPLERERLLYPGDDFDEQDPCAAVR